MLTGLSDKIHRFRSDERAATAIEYAMIASGIAVAIAAVVFGLGSDIKTNFYDRLSNMFGS